MFSIGRSLKENYDRAKIETLIFNPQSTSHNSPDLLRQPQDVRLSAHSRGSASVRTLKPGKGVQEDDVLPLVSKFLTNVHIKNPVLDADDLKKKAKWTVENGFSWDAASCLVVWHS